MSQKTRLIIVAFCVISFFVIAPILVAYSMGYRYDFDKNKIVATGGIYVRTFPAADQITIDFGAPQKPGMFASSVFVQNLLPKQHSVLVKKDGYFNYQKTLNVTEKEVTKIENIILFKSNTSYQKLFDGIESFYVSPDKRNILAEGTSTKTLDLYYFSISNPESRQTYSITIPYTFVLDVKWSDDSNKALVKTQNASDGIAYYLLNFATQAQADEPVSYLDSSLSDISFNPQDSNQIFFVKNGSLYSAKNSKTSVLLKNVVSYKIYNNNIIWISSKGIANKSDITGKNTEPLSKGNLTYFNYADYKIEIVSGKIFLTNPHSLLTYVQASDSIDQFDSKISNYKLLQSPDSRKMAYYNDSQVYLYEFEKSPYNKTDKNNVKIFTAKAGETITNFYWLNNDYIIFQSGNRIIVSEIDYYMGNINTFEIPQTYQLGAESKTPKMIFDSNDSKIYILSNNILYSSEKLVP